MVCETAVCQAHGRHSLNDISGEYLDFSLGNPLGKIPTLSLRVKKHWDWGIHTTSQAGGVWVPGAVQGNSSGWRRGMGEGEKKGQVGHTRMRYRERYCTVPKMPRMTAMMCRKLARIGAHW